MDHGGAETFDLLGFSLGAAVATRLAALHPDRVERLILVGGFVSGHDPRSQLQFRHWADLAKRDPASLARLMLLTGFSHAFLAGIGDVESVVADMVASSNWQGIGRQAELDFQVDVSQDLANVRAHTLVLGNRYDQMVDPRAAIKLANGISGATLEWIEGPHLALMEAPMSVADLVTQHLHD
ncbi:alpha/beta fold hydrolase [Salipiger sp. CCB-MM3]|uniref:alpha/beta fold hydrolase n=1 Tax=Salipiger sp. CCB-MM3 TaxID=1792508 RepID=UPI001F3AC3E1|nr:alpha/beta fold hydrolase [Salipiger sp. CCB-MM3]